MNDEQLFMEVFENFRGKYPAQQLEMVYGTCVSVKGEIKFNIDGYSLLYNLQRLCDAIKVELL